MITIDEIKKLLSKEYGISSDKELEKEIEKMGGIRIAIFTDPRPQRKEE